MIAKAPANPKELARVLKQGEGPDVEFKRSTGELKEGMQTIIAGVFHRVGLIEKWGRGTNRVADMCREAGIALPVFWEIGPYAVVTFRVPAGVTDQVERLLALLGGGLMTAAEIMRGLEMNHRPTLRDNYLHPALRAGFIEMTIPDKPRSSSQKYRLTEKGRQILERRKGAGKE